MENMYLNAVQFKTELEKCLQCPTKPCMKACPVQCSPCDFIKSAKNNDIMAAAKMIQRQNPLGETCGLLCPDKFCVKACLRAKVDYAIKIPAVQALIMKKARENNLLESLSTSVSREKIAVIGAGPAGIGAISELVKAGYKVTVFEKNNHIGGAAALIPEFRLPREVMLYEWGLLKSGGLLEEKFEVSVNNYEDLLSQGFSGVIVCKGEQKLRSLDIEGENLAVPYTEYLRNPNNYKTDGNVAIIGGGSVAADCAATAKRLGAKNVEMFVRRKISNMKITEQERKCLSDIETDITAMTRVVGIFKSDGKLEAHTLKTQFNEAGKLEDMPGSLVIRKNFDYIILALGNTRGEEYRETENIFFAGDFVNGSSTIVEAIASGKNAAQRLIKEMANR